jgi:hypothetical protein
MLSTLALFITLQSTPAFSGDFKRCSNKIALFTPVVIAINPFSHGKLFKILHVYQAARNITLADTDLNNANLSKKHKRRWKKFVRKMQKETKKSGCETKVTSKNLARYVNQKDQELFNCKKDEKILPYKELVKAFAADINQNCNL